MLCSTHQNRFAHKTLQNLSNNDRIKVCKYDKGHGMAVLDTIEYKRKLYEIVNDERKFEAVDFDLSIRNTSYMKKAPWVKCEERAKYYIRTYLKKFTRSENLRHFYANWYRSR